MEISKLRFDKQGLIPAVIQDEFSGDVLMVAYMNEKSLKKTIETKKTHFFSRSRGKFWLKGETSGNLQEVRSIWYDCDLDTLLIKVSQTGVACHTGEWTCFHQAFYEREEPGAREQRKIMEEIWRVIDDRRRNPKEGSYTASLFKRGKEGILEKIIEEAKEVKENSFADNQKGIICEVADLWYHLLVLLNYHGIGLQEIYTELYNRRKKRGVYALLSSPE